MTPETLNRRNNSTTPEVTKIKNECTVFLKKPL
jgi:hypothetical protein